MTPITLSADQQKAFDAFACFIMDPIDPVFVIEGFSGTGKSTLVSHLLERLPSVIEAARLINPSLAERQVILTATTNKAAEALSQISGQEVATIHSFLGLRVNTDYSTGKTTLFPRDRTNIKTDTILFIDEASYIDADLLKLIFSQTKHCKIIFMGDPAQLLTVGCFKAPVFTAGFTTARLTEVMRQAEGNPIIDLSTKFRHTVETGQFFSFKPDGIHIRHMPRDEFDQQISTEFAKPDWSYNQSKVLAWTNKTVINYNHGISNLLTGDPHFKEGDYAICNRFMSSGGCNIKTDQTVRISHISEEMEVYGVTGNTFELDGRALFFMPKSNSDKKACIREAKANNQLSKVANIDRTWIDLRYAFAQTVNKSQGSTYDKVFIDLDDISRCNSADQIARMLYVGVSRARHEVVLTGDLV